MKIIDSRFYRWMEMATNLVMLTLLWLLVSIPVITIFPATTAMFGVFRAWEENESAGIIAPFFAAFRERLLQSLIVGLLWTALGVILVVDIIATRTMNNAVATPLFVATLSFSLFYLMLTIYIYPILANARTSVIGVIKNAFLLSVSQPILTLATAFGLVGVLLLLSIFPVAIVVVGSPIAFGLNVVFNRAVRRFPSVGAAAKEALNIPEPIADPFEEDLAREDRARAARRRD